MAKSSIEWTERTWNPTTGCTKVSSGCKFCYAEIMTRRLKAMGQEKYQYGFKSVMPYYESLNEPIKWKSPQIVFVNSMSDLFHEEIPTSYIQKVFEVMNQNPQHIFQVLTKRADRLLSINEELTWSQNIWMGVSVENDKVVDRIDKLRNIKAKIKFLSLEPLIGPLSNLLLTEIDWVIVGGESGFKPRPMKEEWVLDILEQCREGDIPFFFKQWGGQNKKLAGRMLKGKEYNEMPQVKRNKKARKKHAR